jgi:hypothetical protein
MVLPVATVTGFILLIIGSLGYMGTFAIGEVVSNILMVIGLLVVIAGMALMMYLNRSAGLTQEEE